MSTRRKFGMHRTVPPAPLRLHVNSSDILPTAYSLNIAAEHSAGLSSSYSSTPRALSKTLKFFPKQIISHDLIKDMKKSDFIGFIPNPGFKNNSMLTAGSNTVDGKRAYAICDPRKKTEIGDAETINTAHSPTAAWEDGTAGIGIMAGRHTSAILKTKLPW